MPFQNGLLTSCGESAFLTREKHSTYGETMEKNSFQREIKILVRCRNLLLLIVIVLSGTLFTLLISGSRDKEKIIIAPLTNPHRDFWVEESRCSKRYLEEIGLFLADCLFTKTPADISIKNETVLKHVHPARFQTIKTALAREEKELTRKNQSLSFHPTHFYADPKKLKFFISGKQKAYLEKQKGTFADQVDIHYCLSFEVRRNQVLLIHIHKISKEQKL